MSRRAELLPVFIVSNRLGLSVGFLEHARRAGFGPPYVKVGREARYDWPTVLAWAAQCGLSVTCLDVAAGGEPGDGLNMAGVST